MIEIKYTCSSCGAAYYSEKPPTSSPICPQCEKEHPEPSTPLSPQAGSSPQHTTNTQLRIIAGITALLIICVCAGVYLFHGIAEKRKRSEAVTHFAENIYLTFSPPSDTNTLSTWAEPILDKIKYFQYDTEISRRQSELLSQLMSAVIHYKVFYEFGYGFLQIAKNYDRADYEKKIREYEIEAEQFKAKVKDVAELLRHEE